MHRLVADRPQPVRRRRVEGDRVAGAELELVEADAHTERAARDVAVLPAAVRDERVGGARFGADGILDVEELDIALAVRRQPRPADTGCEVEHAARLRSLDHAVVRGSEGLGRLGVPEDLAHRHAELGHERVQRAHRRVDTVELDLRDEARRDAHAACELAEADAARLALCSQLPSDPGGLELPRDRHVPTAAFCGRRMRSGRRRAGMRPRAAGCTGSACSASRSATRRRGARARAPSPTQGARRPSLL